MGRGREGEGKRHGDGTQRKKFIVKDSSNTGDFELFHSTSFRVCLVTLKSIH